MSRLKRMTGRLAMLGLVLAGAALASPGALAQGCAMCKTSLEGPEDPLAKAITASSIFMVSMPLAVLATIASWVALAIKRGGPLPAEAEDTNDESRGFSE